MIEQRKVLNMVHSIIWSYIQLHADAFIRSVLNSKQAAKFQFCMASMRNLVLQ